VFDDILPVGRVLKPTDFVKELAKRPIAARTTESHDWVSVSARIRVSRLFCTLPQGGKTLTPLRIFKAVDLPILWNDEPHLSKGELSHACYEIGL
jgi:hypothetical protein